MMAVYWTPEALARLEEIEAYIAQDASAPRKTWSPGCSGARGNWRQRPSAADKCETPRIRTYVNCWNVHTI